MRRDSMTGYRRRYWDRRQEEIFWGKKTRGDILGQEEKRRHSATVKVGKIYSETGDKRRYRSTRKKEIFWEEKTFQDRTQENIF